MKVLDHLGVDYLLNKICSTIKSIKDNALSTIKKVTYDELETLRNRCQLIPGQQYQITDYITATKQSDTKSKGFPFDIIVTAINSSTLLENAQVTAHEGVLVGDIVTITRVNNPTPYKYIVTDQIAVFKNSEYYVLKQVDATYNTVFFPVEGVMEENAPVYVNSYSDNLAITGNITTSEFMEFNKSNFKSWEIKYCLANDSVRFMWACESEVQYYLTINGITDIVYMEQGPSIGSNPFYKFTQSSNPNNYVWAMTSDPTSSTTLYTSYFTPAESPDLYKINNAVILRKDLKGTGIIYYMKDEHGNEAPYDFKNIQFKRWQVTSSDSSLTEHLGDIENKYVGIMQTDTFENYMPTNLTIPNSLDCKWFYTFSYVKDGVISDLSIEPYVCEHNIIKPCSELNSPQKLNNIVIGGSLEGIHKNKFEPDCFCMTIGDAFSSNSSCFSNTFGQYSRANIFLGTVIQQNIFGENFAVNLCVGGMSLNSISSYFQSNKVLNNFVGNKIGMKFTHNVIHGEFNQNVFSTQASNNTFYDSIKFNTFGGQTNYNTLTDISQCRFGFGFQHNNINYMLNTAGEALFQYNNFDRVTACTFGNGCRYNTSKLTNNISGETRPYLQGCCFGNYVWYTNLYNSTEGSSSAPIKCITIPSYFQGTESEYAHIEVPTNSSSEIKVARNSQGDIKVYCEADLIA